MLVFGGAPSRCHFSVKALRSVCDTTNLRCKAVPTLSPTFLRCVVNVAGRPRTAFCEVPMVGMSERNAVQWFHKAAFIKARIQRVSRQTPRWHRCNARAEGAHWRIDTGTFFSHSG